MLEDGLIVDLHLRELVQLIVGSFQPKRSHRLRSGAVVQDRTQRLGGFRLAHDSLRHGVYGRCFVHVPKRGKVEGQRGHLLGHFSASLAGHAKADKQVLLIGKVGLDVVFVAANGIGVFLRPFIDLIPHIAEDNIELVLHLFNGGCHLNAAINGALDARDGQRNTDRAEDFRGHRLQRLDAALYLLLGGLIDLVAKQDADVAYGHTGQLASLAISSTRPASTSCSMRYSA